MFPTKILVATNGSRESDRAVEAAVELANGTGSELEIVHVVSTVPELPPPSVTAKERHEALLEQRRLGSVRLLDVQAQRIEDLGAGVTASHYREGRPEKEVVKLAREIDAGLILTGGRRRSWFERIFGRGFSEIVSRKADRPVLVVGPKGPAGSTVLK